MSGPYNYPQIFIKKSLNPPQINKKEWCTVTVTVTGDSRKQTAPVPSAVVLALDYSGSMGYDDAYKEVSAAAKDILNLLNPGVDKIALITIRGTATVEVPLTSNFAGIAQKIDGLEPNGFTNIKDAFIKSNDALKADNSPNKMVILMSDGWPETQSGLDPTQEVYIVDHCYEPVSHGIKYYTIGYGSMPHKLLLQLLADKTGGMYQSSPTKSQLKAAFQTAYQEGAYYLTTSMVEITEAVNPVLQIRPDSLAWSFPSSLEDPIKFQADFKASAQNFHTTHKVTIPMIHQLGQNQVFTFYFDVTFDQCADTPMTIDVDDLASAQVAYDVGKPTKVVDLLPQANLTIFPCDLILTKDFDEETHKVTLRVRNGYNRPVFQVQVLEALSEFFKPVKHTGKGAKPISPSPLRVNRTYRQVWWELPRIDPDQELVFTFHVEGTAAAKKQPAPYPLDFVRASVAYNVDVLEVLVSPAQPEYPSLEQDLKNLIISQGTSNFLNAKGFQVHPGDPILLILSKIGQTPEFPWQIISAGRPLKIKKTADGIGIYKEVRRLKFFPQKWTSKSYVAP